MKSIVFVIACILPAITFAQDLKLKGFDGKKLALIEDVTLGALVSDSHGAEALERYKSNMWQAGRKLTAGVVTVGQLDALKEGEIVAARRKAALEADFWVVPVNSVAIGSTNIEDYASHLGIVTNNKNGYIGQLEKQLPELEFQMPVLLDGRFSAEERRNRLMTTGDKAGGLLVCNEKSGLGACIHLQNINSGTNPLPKWFVADKKQFGTIKSLGPNGIHQPIDAVYAVVVKPKEKRVMTINGMPAFQGEVIQGVLINARTMTPLVRFNQDYKSLGTNNPLIAF